MDGAPRCELCRQVIGVYEPLRLISADGTERQRSRLTLDAEVRRPVTVAMHEACYRRRHTADLDT